MAKTPSVTIPDFFSGPAIEIFPEEKIEAIYTKALELKIMRYDPANGWPANVHKQAMLIVDHIHLIKKAISENNTMAAMIYGFRLGECCQKISTLLAVKDSLNHQDKALAPRVSGGKGAGQQTKEKAEENKQKIIRHWERLEKNKTPEHNRAAIIANQTGITPQTVRRHVKALGLREAD